jgi:hypothetical protein
VSQQEPSPRPPLNAYIVLLVAILLPGFGHVLNGQARRGLIMQLFMIALGFITWQLAPPTASFIGKISGGLFVYAVSLPEAFRVAKLRQLTYERAAAPPNQPPEDNTVG